MNNFFNPEFKTENSVGNDVQVLYSKTLKILSAIISALSISETGKAQVQYTDVNPDLLLPFNVNSFYILDLNNDGIGDFKLGRKTEGWWCGAGGAYGPNYYGGKAGLILENLSPPTLNQSKLSSLSACGSYFQKVENMQAGTVLALNPSSWSNQNPLVSWKAIFATYSGQCGAYCAAYNPYNVDMFVGLRIEVPGAFHLGWLRIMLVSGNVIIKDYAYESTPYRPIIIGSLTSSVGLNEIEETTKIILNGKDLSIQFLNESGKYHIGISNLTGQEINSNDNVNSTWNFTFNQPGVYLVTISNESGKYTKKLFVF